MGSVQGRRKKIGYVLNEGGVLSKIDSIQEVSLLLIALDDKALEAYGYVEAK
jgi:hypothetical protein